MVGKLFDEPVSIVIGLTYTINVVRAEEAYAILAEWPQGTQDPFCRAALQACLAAIQDKLDVAKARDAFINFARKRNILSPAEDAALIASGALSGMVTGRSL